MKFSVSDSKSKLIVEEEFIYKWNHNGVTHRITVPKGFEFRRGISLRLGLLGLLDIFAPTFSLLEVSAVHDYIYWLKENDRTNMPRDVADEVMRSDPNDPEWLQNIAWGIIRVVGYFVW